MIEEELLTAQEATKLYIDAGVSQATFRRRVKGGKIEKRLPAGKQRGAKYSKTEVLRALSQEKPRRVQAKKNELRPTVFLRATLEDVEGMSDLMEAVFGGRPNTQRLIQWVQRNPDLAYILKAERKVVGCGFLLPLKEEKILDILNHDVTPTTHPEEIGLFEPDFPIYLYARSVAVQQTGSSFIQRRKWGEQLVRNLLKVIVSLGSRGVQIEKIYARSDTPDGERLLRHMGFTQISSVTWHKNYVIDIATSGLDVVLAYRYALANWKQKHSGEVL